MWVGGGVLDVGTVAVTQGVLSEIRTKLVRRCGWGGMLDVGTVVVTQGVLSEISTNSCVDVGTVAARWVLSEVRTKLVCRCGYCGGTCAMGPFRGQDKTHVSMWVPWWHPESFQRSGQNSCVDVGTLVAPRVPS